MTFLVIAVAILFAFLAFRFIAGIIKFAVIALIIGIGIFIAHQAGAF